MPPRLPKTRPEQQDMLTRTLTDPYNRQNTAEVVRALFEEWSYSSYNRAEDKLPADKIDGLTQLILSAIPAGNALRVPIKCVYATTRSEENFGRAVREELDPTTLCLGAICYTQKPDQPGEEVAQLVPAEEDDLNSIPVWPDGKYAGTKVQAVWQGVSGGADAVFPANEPVATAGTGLVGPGYVRAGKGLLQVVRDLTTAPETPPTYVQPSAGLSSAPPSGSIIERGVTVLVSLASSFSQGSAGAETGRVIKRGTTVLGTTANASDSIAVSQTVTYTVEVSYGQGPVLNGSNGTPYPGGQIPAGTVTASAVLIPQTPTYYGAVNSPSPPESTMRGLTKQLWGPGSRDVEINCNSQYPAFWEPQSNGIRTVVKDKNNFTITADVTRSALALQLADGSMETGWLYVHKNPQTDTTFTFKF